MHERQRQHNGPDPRSCQMSVRVDGSRIDDGFAPENRHDGSHTPSVLFRLTVSSAMQRLAGLV